MKTGFDYLRVSRFSPAEPLCNPATNQKAGYVHNTYKNTKKMTKESMEAQNSSAIFFENLFQILSYKNKNKTIVEKLILMAMYFRRNESFVGLKKVKYKNLWYVI